MLKRIRKIQNIGRFKDASCGRLQFEKITLIFGRNTYGKSTLGDLFASISSGDTSGLKARKTIPNDGRPQEAIVCFQCEGGSEQSLSIENNSWQPALPDPLKLLVFDDGFYHNNVFAARQFTRSTKENFSSFVLGTQGVVKAKKIAKENKRKRGVTTEKNKLHKAVFEEVENLVAFLDLAPKGSVEELRKELDGKHKKYDELSKQKKDSAIILERKEFVDLRWRGGLADLLDEINNCLQTSLETHHKAAREKLAEHIADNFKNTNNAELWIRQGVEQNLGEKCQFCGQKLGENALRLLEVYQQSFDDSFEKHDQTIRQTLARCRSSILQERTVELKIAIEKNHTVIVSYPELAENSRYAELKGTVAELVISLNQILDSWDRELLKVKERIDNVFEKKYESPHVAIQKIQFEGLLHINNGVLGIVDEINIIGKEIRTIVNNFKSSTQNDKISESIKQILIQGETLARNIKRLELSEQCDEYNRLTLELKNLSLQIPVLQKELRDEQSKFLNKYFKRLNLHFEEFGSSDFKLEVGENTSGHTPIYYLKVKFRNIDISERELDKVFSESDRRALSLAVFWARLSGVTDEEKKNIIVVLDDPVTSFDTNRISSVHRKIVTISDEVRQIIVLSHYEQEISRFLTTYRNSKPICFLSITNTNAESTLNTESIDNFVMNDHEKVREGILNFVSGGDNLHNATELRIFFEVEIGLRFAKQIRDFNVNEHNLSDRINKLHEHGVISEDIAKKCHTWREALNPSHHIWVGSDIEDQRNTAKGFMEFVYKGLVPLSVGSQAI